MFGSRISKKVRVPDQGLNYHTKESKGSLGLVEGCHVMTEGQIRTLVIWLETVYRCLIGWKPKLMPWLVRHTGWLLTRFQVHASDGRTSYEHLYGKPYRHEVVNFGEQVYYKILSRAHDKLEPRWETGVWVGKRARSDEHLLMTKHGIAKSRSIRRKQESAKYDPKVLEPVKGLPWNPVAVQHREGLAATGISIEKTSAYRRMYITTKKVREKGATPSCADCKASLEGKSGIEHSSECRKRFEEMYGKLSQQQRPKRSMSPKAKRLKRSKFRKQIRKIVNERVTLQRW